MQPLGLKDSCINISAPLQVQQERSQQPWGRGEEVAPGAPHPCKGGTPTGRGGSHLSPCRAGTADMDQWSSSSAQGDNVLPCLRHGSGGPGPLAQSAGSQVGSPGTVSAALPTPLGSGPHTQGRRACVGSGRRRLYLVASTRTSHHLLLAMWSSRALGQLPAPHPGSGPMGPAAPAHLRAKLYTW